MSEKAELQNLFKSITYLVTQSIFCFSATLKSKKCIEIASEAPSDLDKVESLLGNKKSECDAKSEYKLTFYGCPVESIDSYFKSLKFFAKCTKSYASAAYPNLYKVELLLGSREPEFDAKVEAKASPYRCSKAEMDSYMDNMNFIEFHRCIGVSERTSLEVIDEMF